MRGPLCTSGIEDLRSGDVPAPGRRRSGRDPQRRLGLGDWLALHRPRSTSWTRENQFGAELRSALADRVSRQLLLGVHDGAPARREQPGERRRQATATSWVTRGRSCRRHRRLHPRPASPSRGGCPSESTSGSAPRTAPATTADDSGCCRARGRGLRQPRRQPLGRDPHHGYRAGQLGGRQQQRSWDHENLYLVGAGSMPSVGTSNTTLTLAGAVLPHRRAHRSADLQST